MTIEIIAIGNELLKGITTNSNATVISRLLNLHGYSIARHTVLPDFLPFLEAGMKEALARADLVIATGGLGPTCDDVTREAAAQVFSSPFHTDARLVKELQERFKGNLKSLADQARVPVKARLLKNQIGTAPGMIFSESGKTLVLLPGVPQEMILMLEKELLPVLPEFIVCDKNHVSKLLHFGLLKEDDVDPLLRQLQTQFPKLEFGIYPSYGFLSVRLSSSHRESLNECERSLKETFCDFLFEDDAGKIEHAVKTLFVEKQATLACAESCTGGQISAKITSIPGASGYFIASLVTYSNAMKEQLLGVKKEMLNQFGAVSKEVVLAMAQGLVQRTQADYGIAVSGIAGPDGGTQEKPVGMVWIAIAKHNGTSEAICVMLRGSRETIITSATHRALFFLWRLVAKGDPLSKWERPR